MEHYSLLPELGFPSQPLNALLPQAPTPKCDCETSTYLPLQSYAPPAPNNFDLTTALFLILMSVLLSFALVKVSRLHKRP